MKILIYHPEKMPPKTYGGTERVVLWLAKGLIKLGHQVWVATVAQSQLPDGVRKISLPQKKRGFKAVDSISFLKKHLPKGIDVCHWMVPVLEEQMTDFPCPFVFTLHGQGKVGEVFPKNTVFLTRRHAQLHGGSVYVYHGLCPEEYLFYPKEKKLNRTLFLSKTSWKVKNLRGAMRLASEAKTPLWIAGGHRPWSLHLWALCDPLFEWIGPVAGDQKALLLAQSAQLLFPIVWEEPFGLVVIEALFSGTPVLGCPRGSLSELVTDEVGMLIEEQNQEQWIEVLREQGKRWDPQRCRAYAFERFHFLRMAQDYVHIYKKVQTELLHRKTPQKTLLKIHGGVECVF